MDTPGEFVIAAGRSETSTRSASGIRNASKELALEQRPVERSPAEHAHRVGCYASACSNNRISVIVSKATTYPSGRSGAQARARAAGSALSSSTRRCSLQSGNETRLPRIVAVWVADMAAPHRSPLRLAYAGIATPMRAQHRLEPSAVTRGSSERRGSRWIRGPGRACGRSSGEAWASGVPLDVKGGRASRRVVRERRVRERGALQLPQTGDFHPMYARDTT
jgi:hypothetical protein